jgi:hypothetical protein
MSTDFKKILLKDPRLMVTDQLAYGVKKGGQSIVSQRASAIAQSTSSVNFNVQIPSEQTIVDRRVWVKSTVVLQFQTSPQFGTNGPQLVYGQNIALAAFPFHQLASTVQATLNNNVTSINMKDVLPFLIRSNDVRMVSRASSSCPTKPDNMYTTFDEAGYAGQFAQANCFFAGQWVSPGLPAPVVTPTVFNQVVIPTPVSSTFANFSNSASDIDLMGNSAFSYYGATSNTPNTGVDAPVQLYYSTTNTAAGPYQLQTTGAGVTGNTNTLPGPVYGSTWWQLVFTTVEPVLVQPFLWSDPVSNKQGIYGLQTIQLQYNLSAPNRAFRVVNQMNGVGAITINNLTIQSVTNSELIFKFLTPHPSDLLPARNVIPLLTYDRYFSNASNATIPPNFGGIVPITSNTYNLTQVPDKICVFLRKKQSLQTPTDQDWSPVISGISINWNNNAGLLSSATLQDLYYYSVEAGSNQSFQQYCGQAYASQGSYTGALGAGISNFTSMIGSYLMLDFATVIQLTEDFYSCGSLGNFQLQFQLQLQNQSGVAIPSNSLEIVLVVMNSGIMVTDRGQTSTYTGILTKQDVLDVSQTEALSITDVGRIVGSGSMDKGRALPMKVCDMLRKERGHHNNPPVLRPAVEPPNKMSSRLM